ncbi:hypothetical protein ASG87_12705 [Frateuria sp. Soil773]|uniref:DUF6289 family protein n=1 Tax=Frateuria sp. Soil773 TaxID=1736407 RepID=UPI0006FB7997|nr:DUF6289 family protein [Frateuria sp. Soil773]KRF00547.1 hypothetical protein ASG87_12705 [Frateuria sp. Soil773]
MRRNHTIAIVTALLLAGIAGAARANFAPLGTSQDVQYFSDPAHTQRVGGWRVECDGMSETWGARGPYQTMTRVACPVP